MLTKRKIPPVESLNVKAELELLNANMEKLSEVLDALTSTVTEMAKRNKIQDERQSFLGIKVGKMENTLDDMQVNHSAKPKKITMDVTSRDEVTGQINQVELNLE